VVGLTDEDIEKIDDFEGTVASRSLFFESAEQVPLTSGSDNHRNTTVLW
jgi:hypothetical protein